MISAQKWVAAVSDMLGSHHWDPAHKEQLKKKEQRRESQQNNSDNQSPNGESESETQLAQQHTICYCCGENGHVRLSKEG